MFSDNVSLKETAKLAIGEAVVLVLMCAVFWLFDRFDMTVVWGGLLGAAANLLYFILICIGVNSAIRETSTKRQKMSLTISYYLRLLLLGICLAIGLKMDCFHNIAVIVPVLMTRPIFMAAEVLGKGVKE